MLKCLPGSWTFREEIWESKRKHTGFRRVVSKHKNEESYGKHAYGVHGEEIKGTWMSKFVNC